MSDWVSVWWVNILGVSDENCIFVLSDMVVFVKRSVLCVFLDVLFWDDKVDGVGLVRKWGMIVWVKFYLVIILVLSLVFKFVFDFFKNFFKLNFVFIL